MAVLSIERDTIFGPEHNGILMTPAEFDRSEYEDGWVFELINGVLIVTPIPLEEEADPNEELGTLLRIYQRQHPLGYSLTRTLGERTISTGKNRRRADRVIWAGLNRKPRSGEKPTIVVEFVSGRKRDRERDYLTKREEYLSCGIKEYWIIDRFTRSMTIFTRVLGRNRSKVFQESQIAETPLLPGFKLPLKDILACADYWASRKNENGE